MHHPFFKRRLATLLVFVMALSYLLSGLSPFFNPLVVLAAPAIQMELHNHMAPGTANAHPLRLSGGANEQVRLNFPIGGVGTYTLEFAVPVPNSDTLIPVQMIIERVGTQVVSVRYGTPGAPAAPLEINVGNNGFVPAVNPDTGGTSALFEGGFAAQRSLDAVDRFDFIPPGLPGTPTAAEPHFLISEGRGFSFIMDLQDGPHVVRQTVHFQLVDGQFYFAADGFIPGHVFQFRTTHRFPGAATYTSSINHANTGVNGLRFTPFANAVGAPVAPGQQGPSLLEGSYEVSLRGAHLFRRTDIAHRIVHSRAHDDFVPFGRAEWHGRIMEELNAGRRNEFPRWPAMSDNQEEVGLTMSFDIPRDALYDGTGRLLGQAMQAQVVIDPGINFVLTGIHTDTPSAMAVSGNLRIDHVSRNTQTNLIEVDIMLPEAGVLYNSATIELISDIATLPITSRPTVLTGAEVHTLPNFEVGLINNVHHVMIPEGTFANSAGQWVLIESPNPQFIEAGHFIRAGRHFNSDELEQQPGGIRPSETLSIASTGVNTTGVFLQLFFIAGESPQFERPEDWNYTGFLNYLNPVPLPSGAPGTPPNRPNVIRSQVLFFRGDETEISLDTLEPFTATWTQHRPIAGDLTRRRGEGYLDLSWSLSPTTPNVLLSWLQAEAITAPAGATSVYVDIDYHIYSDIDPEMVNRPDTTNPAHRDQYLVLRTRVFANLGNPATPGGPPTVQPGSWQVAHNLIQHNGQIAPNGTVSGVTLQNPAGPGWADNRVPITGTANNWMGNVRLVVQTIDENAPAEVPFPGAVGGIPRRWAHGFVFPSVNFLQMSVHPAEAAHRLYSSSSNITVSGFDRSEVPIPQNVTLTNPVSLATAVGNNADRVSLDVHLDLPAQQIREYLVQSYGLFPGSPGTPGQPSLPNFDRDRIDITLNLYISQNESRLRNDLLGTNNVERFSASDDGRHRARQLLVVPGARPSARLIPPGPEVVTPENPNPYANIHQAFDFGGMPNSPVTVPAAVTNALRSPNGIVAIDNITLTPAQIDAILGSEVSVPLGLRLHGLDENSRYYVMVDLKIVQRTDETPAVEITESSFLSALSGLTTPGFEVAPDGTGNEPAAPVLRIVGEPSMDSVTLGWQPISPMGVPAGYTETMEYEIIRTRNTQIRPTDYLVAFLNNRVGFGQAWNTAASGHASENILGARTESASPTPLAATVPLRTWTGTSWGPHFELYRLSLEYDTETGELRLVDNTLDSNSLYFYYVRTVRTIRNAAGAQLNETFSVWSHINATTGIAGAPRNLVAETGRDDYDRMHEIVISFEAPISFAIRAERLGNSVMLQYQIQVDDEGWYPAGGTNMNVAALLATPGRTGSTAHAEPDWTNFLYHITGLEAGRLTSVRVRMVELDGNGNAVSYSMWSNVAQWLTDRDPAADEEDRLLNDWSNHAREEIYRLLRSPYWLMRHDNQAFVSVLRPSMFSEMLRSGVGGHIVLPFELAQQTVYYIPAVSFTQAVTAGASWVLPADRLRVVLPHNTIDMDNNQAMLAMTRAIRERSGDISDYFVRLSVNWSIVTEIHGQPALTPSAHVSLALVAVEQNLGVWEQETLANLIASIDELESLARYLERIEDGIRGYADNFELQRYVQQMVDVATYAFMNQVREDFTQVTRNNQSLPVNFDNSIMMSATAPEGATAAVEAYTFVGGLWARIGTTFDNGSGALVASSAPVAFTGRVINIPGIQGQASAAQTTGIVARHGLDEFWGLGYMDVTATATRGQLIDGVARVLGAPRGTTNSQAWLRDRGINLTPGVATAPITTQEALHMLMQVYASQTNTSIESIRITNFGATAHTQGLNPAFATSFRAAVEIGLATGAEATAQVSIGQLLDKLTRLDSLVSL